jgi:hypothetical protein
MVFVTVAEFVRVGEMVQVGVIEPAGPGFEGFLLRQLQVNNKRTIKEKNITTKFFFMSFYPQAGYFPCFKIFARRAGRCRYIRNKDN